MYATTAKPATRAIIAAGAAATLAVLLGLCIAAARQPWHGAVPAAAVVVSHKDRSFAPGRIAVPVGQVLTFVNDDGGAVHHAYVDTPGFRFDSGDQVPGGRSDVTFDVPGTFRVLCGVHPKMRLDVDVGGTQAH